MISVAGDSAVVSVKAGVDCARCRAGKGCGAGLFGGSPEDMRNLEVAIAEGLVLRSGDRVRLSLQPRHLLQAAWYVYGLPLAGIVLALVMASWQFGSPGDQVAMLYALVGFATGLSAGRYLLGRNSCLRNLVPVISERLAAAGADAGRDGN